MGGVLITETSEPNDHPELSPPDGRLLWTSPEMIDSFGRPTFRTKQVAWFFFARGHMWLYKNLLVPPHQVLDHPEVGTLAVPRQANSYRVWRLYDVELYAHILASHRRIQGWQLVHTITLVKTSAQLWGFIP